MENKWINNEIVTYLNYMEKLRRQVIVKVVKYVVTYVTLLTLFVTDFTNIVNRNRALKIIYNTQNPC